MDPYSYVLDPWSCAPRIRAELAAPIATEPLTLDQAKLLAGLDWAVGDPRDQMILDFIAAARAQVEQDTNRALPLQARDLFFDTLPATVAWYALPPQTVPLQAVTSISAVDSQGVITPLDPSAYAVAITNDGLTLSILTAPPDVQRWVVRVQSGSATLPPSLLFAVGLLTAHYMTTGRDLTITGTIVATTPHGYAEAIAAHILMVAA
jgi:uncharacterized phiE125 gp8 family phage protein